MSKYIHIDHDINILTDEEAKKALSKENDQIFLSKKQGIFRIPLERWKIAQQAERKHWMELGINTNSDRNEEHFVKFDRYKVLQGLSFESAIELGCGPFTNLRFIGNICKIKECTLLDPLIASYIDHPHCSFDKQFLFTEDTHRSLFYKRIRYRLMSCLPKLYGLVRSHSSHKVPVKEMIVSPIELMSTNQQYDFLVIINVIEHCYDLELAFKNIIAVMKKGAIIVFHDKYYDHSNVEQTVKTYYDAAHPLQADRKLINSFLKINFDTLYNRIETHHSNWLGVEDEYDCIYFIGKKF